MVASEQSGDRNWQALAELFAAGRIRPKVSRVYPFEEYAAALRCLSERQAIGKVVVQVREST